MTNRNAADTILQNRQHSNALIATYSKLFLEIMDQKLDRHFNKDHQDHLVTWSDDDLV